MRSRLPISSHANLPWRIAELAPDFALIDAWALPASGRLEEFSDLCAVFEKLEPAGGGGSESPSRLSNALFAIRNWLGEKLGWDAELNTLPIPGCRETSLRDRLPADLKDSAAASIGDSPFRPIYRTRDEYAAELSNQTVHAILHLGWVPQSSGDYRGQLGVYVKTRGRLGPLYMAAIAPFRHYIVYPALMRRIDRVWKNRHGSDSAT